MTNTGHNCIRDTLHVPSADLVEILQATAKRLREEFEHPAPNLPFDSPISALDAQVVELMAKYVVADCVYEFTFEEFTTLVRDGVFSPRRYRLAQARLVG